MEVKVIEPKIHKQKQKEKLRVAAYARVSTASNEQEDSFEHQVKYYTEKIQSNENYSFAGVYADQAISGTTDKRPQFQQMIEDAKRGKIDLILTKSISRFSRNVADLSKYVQLLKSLSVDVIFEEDGIRLLDDKSSLLLNILASVAQMEVENTSSHINWTLQEKMKRGELVGKPDCLGYDVVEGKLVVNEEEAAIVRFIFAEYLAGKGCHRIVKELEQMGVKTKRGGTRWHETTLVKILTNEKYTGTLLQGKTTTVNAIGHVRKKNEGLARQYVQEDAHEAIISKEDFEKAAEILASRTIRDENGRTRFTTTNAAFSPFTSKIECFFCGKHYVRRTVHSGSKYEKRVWQCSTYAKRGKSECTESKVIDEDVIKAAFMKLVKILFYSEDSIFAISSETFAELKKTQKLSQEIDAQKIKSIEKKISKLLQRQSALVDMLLDAAIDKATYEAKRSELIAEIETLTTEKQALEEKQKQKKKEAKTIEEIYAILDKQQESIEMFDEKLFQKLVKKVVIGGIRSEDNTVDPKMITFELNIEHFNYTKEEQEKIEKELYSHYDDNSCRVHSVHTKEITLHYMHRDWIRAGSRYSHYENREHEYHIRIEIH